MPRKEAKEQQRLNTGATRRSRGGRAPRGSKVPRIMIMAVLVIVALGAALFWPRGGDVPTGIGENQTVVSSPGGVAGQPDVRSGDVDINAEGVANLTPEKQDHTPEQAALQTGPPLEQANPEKESDKAPEQQAQEKPAATKTPEPTPPPKKKTVKKPVQQAPRIQPQSRGPYAVQAGAFGKAENADAEAARLKSLGWDARVLANNNSAGDMVFRVRIGFFTSRSQAQTFINQNSRKLPGAIPVHR